MKNEKLKIEEIKVIREFEILLPKNTEIVKEQLEKSILNFGVKDPLIITKIDNQNILIDGHHRFEIIKKHNLDFNCVFLDFETKEEVKEWMIKNQINKRNLNKAQNMFVIGCLYQSKIKDRIHNFKGEPTGNNTAAEVAKIFNISESSVKNYADYAKLLGKFDEDYKNAFLEYNETRKEIIQNIFDNYYFVLCSQSPRWISHPIKEVIEGAEWNLKHKKEKTEKNAKITKSQNLTFAEQQPKQKNNTAKEQQTEPKKQIQNSNLSNVKTYTELDIQELKLQVEYYKELAELKNFEFQQIKKQIDDNEKIIEHLRQEKTTGLKTWDRIKINDSDLIIMVL